MHDPDTRRNQAEEQLLEGLRTERNDAVRAETLARETWALCQEIGYEAGQAHALRNLGYARFAQGDSDGARHHLTEGLALACRTGDSGAIALCLHTLAVIYQNLGRLTEALNCYQEAAALREGIGATSLLAGTLNNIGSVHFLLGDLDAALTANQHALSLWRAAGNAYGEAFTLNNIGSLYLRCGRNDDALRHHQAALEMAQRMNDSTLRATCLVCLATARRHSGDNEGAFRDATAARETAQRIPDRRREAQALEEIGALFCARGQIAPARQCFGQALRQSRRAGHLHEMASLLHTIGLLHHRQGDLRRARSVLGRCLRLAESHQLKYLCRDAHLALTDTLDALGDPAAALSHHRRYHALDQEMSAQARERQRLLLLHEIEMEKARHDTEIARLRNVELARAQERLRAANTRLKQIVDRDSMTGLLNHRAFQERLRAEAARARRSGAPLAVALIDVDDFKKYNDTFGHPAGDRVLRQIARLLSRRQRAADTAARYGGEEFALLFPETTLETAVSIVERLRQSVAACPFPHRAIHISAGVAGASGPSLDSPSLIAQADRALYVAKRAGRNRVEIALTLIALAA